MAAKGLDVKHIDEIQRLKSLGCGRRKVARALNIHRNTVSRYWEEPRIEDFPTVALAVDAWVNKIDWPGVRDEVQTGVPVSVVFEELFAKGIVPVQYPAFWKQLVRRAPNLKTTMVRVFAPGSRTEIDYCDGVEIVNLSTGEMLKTQFFIGVLCSSRYVFAEFTMTQRSEDFLASHARMFEFFGGCTQVVSPDNLKSAVTRAHRYDPVLNPAYTRLAAHYGIAVVPARVRRPQDKAIVERTIQIFQRWFFMLIRHRTFTSLLELNQCLKEHLVRFHAKPHRVFRRTRAEMFEDERSSLMPLPQTPYLVSTHAKAKLSRDCHLSFERNFYSAPHELRGLELDVWVTTNVVEIYHQIERVALHARGKTQGKFVTDNKHYPLEHQAYLEEDITKTKSWAYDVGTQTAKLIEGLLSGPYPLRHLRRAQGMLALSKPYSKEQLEAAVTVANRFNQKNINYVERVIKNLERQRRAKGGEAIKRATNPHLRGVERITVH